MVNGGNMQYVSLSCGCGCGKKRTKQERVLVLDLGPPAAKKVYFFLAFPSTFLVKLGGFHIFVLTYASLRSPLRAEYFGTRIGPVRWSHHVAMRMLVFFTHANVMKWCVISFTIANYNVMGTSGTTDKCTKMLNSRWVSRRYMGLSKNTKPSQFYLLFIDA